MIFFWQTEFSIIRKEIGSAKKSNLLDNSDNGKVTQGNPDDLVIIRKKKQMENYDSQTM